MYNCAETEPIGNQTIKEKNGRCVRNESKKNLKDVKQAEPHRFNIRQK